MSEIKSTIWAENIKEIFFFNLGIVPTSGHTTIENINALTRLTLLACIIIGFFKPVLAVSTFLIISVILLAIYYGCSSSKEGYNDDGDNIGLAGDLFKYSHTFPITKTRFCNDVQPLRYDEEFFSKNQMLVGGPNPKTFIPPIIAPPSHELSEWKTTDLTINSAINDSTNYDVSAAGYIGDYFDFDKDYFGYASRIKIDPNPPPICSECLLAPCRCSNNPPTRSDQLRTSTIQPRVYERSDFSEPINSLIGISQQKQFDPTRITFTKNDGIMYSAIQSPFPYHKDEEIDEYSSRYYFDEIEDDRHRNNNRHHKSKNRPTVKENFEYLPDITFSSFDSSSSSTTSMMNNLQTESDVYDPRFTGYGPTDRGYLDPMNGNPKFFYDDINAVIMPNFICRNKVDIYPWASQYGSGINGSLSYGIGTGDGYKRLAENAFADATIKFRTEMQERLMRKRNAEMWQRRMAPIHTMG